MKATKKLLMFAFVAALIVTMFAAFAITSSAATIVKSYEMELYPTGYSDLTYGDEIKGQYFISLEDGNYEIIGEDELGLAGSFLEYIVKDVEETGTDPLCMNISIDPVDTSLTFGDAGTYKMSLSSYWESALSVSVLNLSIANSSMYTDGEMTPTTQQRTINKNENYIQYYIEGTISGSKLANGSSIDGDYAITYKYVLPELTVKQKALTLSDVSVTAADKIYDGTTSAKLNYTATVTGAVSGTPTFTLTGEFADANVGTGKTVTVTGATIKNSNYSFDATAFTNLTATADITAKTVTVDASSYSVTTSKTYNGDDKAAIDWTNAAVVGATNVTVTGATATYNSSNVADANTITVEFKLSDSNYKVEPVTLDGTITAATLTLVDYDLTTEKIYDGNIKADISGGSLSGIYNNDDVSFTTPDAVYNSKNVNEANKITVTVNLDGAAKGNYTIAPFDVTDGVKITRKTVTLIDYGVEISKPYDGNDEAEVTAIGTLSGVEDGDDFKVDNITAKYDRHDVYAFSIAITIETSGADSGNYNVEGITLTDGVEITAKWLEIDGFDFGNSGEKVYDGKEDVRATATLVGVVEGETVELALTATADKNVGDNAVTITSAVITGEDAYNYIIDDVGTINEKADGAFSVEVTPATITLTDIEAKDKIYDGKTTAEVTFNFDGVIGEDDVKVVYTANFEDKNAAENKTVSVTFALEGEDATNYVLDTTTETRTATITPRELTLGMVTVIAKDKVYDGNTVATLDAPEINKGLVEGDVLKSRWIGTFAQKDVGEDIAVEVKLTLEGENAMNYVIVDIPESGIIPAANLNAEVKADITKATLTIKFPNVEYTYGTTFKDYVNDNAATLEPQAQIVGLVAGDSCVTTMSDGTNHDLSISEIQNAGKYTLVFTNPNYNVVLIGGEITINRAVVEGQLALGDDWTQVIYGDELPEGWESLVTGLPAIPEGITLTTDYVVGNNVGDYNITAVVSDEIALNYDVHIEGTTFSVAKRDLTITANDASVEYGDDEPEYSVSYEGLADCDLNEDGTINLNREHFTVDEIFTLNYSATDAAGTTHKIIMVNYVFESENYNVTKKNGTLTVVKRVIDVEVNELEVTYGDAIDLSALTYVIEEGFLYGDTFASAFGVEVSAIYNYVTTSYVPGTAVADSATVTIEISGLEADNYELNITYDGVKINKRDVALTVEDFTVAYGNTPDATGKYTLNAEQIYNNDTINVTFTYINASDVAYVAGTANAGETFTVNAAIDNANYNLVYEAPATLTVTTKAVTLTVGNGSIEYGSTLDDAALTVTPEGFFGTQGVTYTLSGYAAGNDKGEYTITIADDAIVANADTNLDNYVITVVDGTLTVTAKKVTLTVNDKNITYGDEAANDGFNVSYTFDGDVVLAADKVTYTYNTKADGTGDAYAPGSPVSGTYYIIAAFDVADVDSNYEIEANIAGKLIVGKKAITVTAGDVSVQFGLEIPEGAFTYTVDPALFGSDTVEVTYSYEYVAGTTVVGTYAINITVVNDNYDITTVAGTLSVTKRLIDVTVDLDTPTIYYGSAFNGLGIVTIDEKFASVIEQTASNTVAVAEGYDTTDAAKRGIGDYAVTVTTVTLLDTDNYQLNYVGETTLTVAPLEITITPDDKSVIYGDDAPEYTWDGCKKLIPYTEDLTEFEANIALSCEYVKVTSVSGKYAIKAEFINDYANDNYTVTFAEGTLTVAKKAVTFKVPDAEIYYGNDEPDYIETIVWTGLLDGDTLENSFEGSLVIDAINYSVGSNVSDGYAVTVYNYLNSDKYIATYEGTTTLKVNARPITLTAKSFGITYGDIVPEFEVTVSGEGLALDHEIADLGTVALSSTYSGTLVGEYDIILAFTGNGGVSENYDITTVNGKLVVVSKTVYIIPENVSVLYGTTPDPVIGFTYSGAVNGEVLSFVGSVIREEGTEIGDYAYIGLSDDFAVLNPNYRVGGIDPECTSMFSIVNLSISNVSVTLGFRDEIFMNYYFKINIVGDVELAKGEGVYGLLQWTEAQYNALGGNYELEGNEQYRLDAGIVENNENYNLKANGQAIAAYLYDGNYYARAYVKLADGTYVYGNIIEYSVVDYARAMIEGDYGNEIKALMIALLDYGTATQLYFDNDATVATYDFITDEIRTACGLKKFEDLTMPVIDDSLKTVDGVDYNSALNWTQGSATFDGAFKLNFYGVAVNEQYTAENFGIIYWTEDMIEDGKFIPANGVTLMLGETALNKYDEEGYKFTTSDIGYVFSVDDLAAADGTDRYYVAMVLFDAEGNIESCGRVTFLSIEDYASLVYTSSASEYAKEVGKKVLVYLDAAKAYFGE